MEAQRAFLADSGLADEVEAVRAASSASGREGNASGKGFEEQVCTFATAAMVQALGLAPFGESL